jgi:hypothetical protein
MRLKKHTLCSPPIWNDQSAEKVSEDIMQKGNNVHDDH